MGAMSGSASTEIDAPLEAVWAIVQDIETAPEYALDGDPGVLIGRFLKGALEQKVRGLLIEGRPAELKARVEAG